MRDRSVWNSSADSTLGLWTMSSSTGSSSSSTCESDSRGRAARRLPVEPVGVEQIPGPGLLGRDVHAIAVAGIHDLGERPFGAIEVIAERGQHDTLADGACVRRHRAPTAAVGAVSRDNRPARNAPATATSTAATASHPRHAVERGVSHPGVVELRLEARPHGGAVVVAALRHRLRAGGFECLSQRGRLGTARLTLLEMRLHGLAPAGSTSSSTNAMSWSSATCVMDRSSSPGPAPGASSRRRGRCCVSSRPGSARASR